MSSRLRAAVAMPRVGSGGVPAARRDAGRVAKAEIRLAEICSGKLVSVRR